MRSLALLLIVASLVPLAQAQQPMDPIVHDVRFMLEDQNVTSVDIIEDHGKVFSFEVDLEDPDFGGEILLVELGIQTPNGRIVVRPELVHKDGDIETWLGVHPVDDVRLTTGTFPVDLRVFDRNGGQTTCPITGSQGACEGGPDVDSVQVTWDSKGSHTLSLGLLDAEAVGGVFPDQVMGPTDKIRLDVRLGTSDGQTPWAMQHVRFTNEYGNLKTAAKSLRVPYVIGPLDLQQGEQDLTITATDRAGRSTTINVHADVDTLAPSVDLILPEVTYQNVSFQARLDVQDANDYTATLSLDDVQKVQQGGPGKLLDPFRFTRSEVGTSNLLVRVVDALGNQYLQAVNVTTVPATTDSTIRVEVTPSHPLPEEDVVVTFTAQQQRGVATLPFNVSFQVGDLGQVCCDEGVNVSLDEPFTFTFNRSYLPGQYAYNATIHAVEGVNETDDGDQTDLGFFEVFMGKVVHKDDIYYMRLGEGGIEPSHAVSPGGSLYDVSPQNLANRTVFAFTAKGVDLYWDPLQRVTDLTPEEPGDEESPGVPALAALLVVVAAAYVARRRM